jgi:hypothetical protein
MEFDACFRDGHRFEDNAARAVPDDHARHRISYSVFFFVCLPNLQDPLLIIRCSPLVDAGQLLESLSDYIPPPGTCLL